MKTKTINAVMSKKMNEWLKSIEDIELQSLLKENIIVTGGSITSMLLNEEINDFDVYLKSKNAVKRVSEYYVKKFNENNKSQFNKIGRKSIAWVLDGKDIEEWKNNNKKLSSFAYNYSDIEYSKYLEYVNNNSEDIVEDNKDNTFIKVSGMLSNTPENRIKIMVNSDGIAEDSDFLADKNEYDIDSYLDALSDGDEIDYNSSSEYIKEISKDKYRPIFLSTNAITLADKVQVVIRFYGNPEDIHENYDFIHATNYWTFKTGVVLNQPALEAILNKELFYSGSKYPIASLIRTRKFIKRGWQINAGQYVKMAFQISELDLSNIYILEDQLVGVDSIYFLNFIENMRKLYSKDKSFKINKDYVITVIDKIFK